MAEKVGRTMRIVIVMSRMKSSSVGVKEAKSCY